MDILINSSTSSVEKSGENYIDKADGVVFSDNNSHHIIAFYHVSALSTCHRCHQQYLNIKGFNHVCEN